MKIKYDNSERLEAVSDKQWRDALDELTAYLRWRLKGRTQRGASDYLTVFHYDGAERTAAFFHALRRQAYRLTHESLVLLSDVVFHFVNYFLQR